MSGNNLIITNLQSAFLIGIPPFRRMVFHAADEFGNQFLVGCVGGKAFLQCVDFVVGQAAQRGEEFVDDFVRECGTI